MLQGSLLKQLAIANKSVGGGVVVVLAERDKEEMEIDIAKLEFDFMGTSVICRSGSPLILADLKKVHWGSLNVILCSYEFPTTFTSVSSFVQTSSVIYAHSPNSTSNYFCWYLSFSMVVRTDSFSCSSMFSVYYCSPSLPLSSPPGCIKGMI